MTVERVQLRRTKGWRKPEGTIVVARPTRWGNPFSGHRFGFDVELAVSLYDNLVRGFWDPFIFKHLSDEDYAQIAEARRAWLQRLTHGGRAHPTDLARAVLSGRNLACWCPLGQPCHADVLLRLANAS